MPILENITLNLDLESVLRAQEMDPEEIARRRPDLIQDTRQVLEEGQKYFNPRVLYETYSVKKVSHTILELERGKTLGSTFLIHHLAAAENIYVLLCTIGESLERRVSELFHENPLRAFMLDAMGTAAVERLSSNAARYFESQAQDKGYGISIPLSPGMEGWPLEEGQPQIFNLVPGEKIGVRVNEGVSMTPAKSLSLVLGVGPEIETMGTICDFCAVRSTCRHRDNQPGVTE